MDGADAEEVRRIRLHGCRRQRRQEARGRRTVPAGGPAPFTVVYDPEGATPGAWNVKAMPSSFVVDTKGNVAWVEAGFRDEDVAEARAADRRR
jgi:hypothetical protein